MEHRREPMGGELDSPPFVSSNWTIDNDRLIGSNRTNDNDTGDSNSVPNDQFIDDLSMRVRNLLLNLEDEPNLDTQSLVEGRDSRNKPASIPQQDSEFRTLPLRMNLESDSNDGRSRVLFQSHAVPSSKDSKPLSAHENARMTSNQKIGDSQISMSKSSQLPKIVVSGNDPNISPVSIGTAKPCVSYKDFSNALHGESSSTSRHNENVADKYQLSLKSYVFSGVASQRISSSVESISKNKSRLLEPDAKYESIEKEAERSWSEITVKAESFTQPAQFSTHRGENPDQSFQLSTKPLQTPGINAKRKNLGGYNIEKKNVLVSTSRPSAVDNSNNRSRYVVDNSNARLRISNANASRPSSMDKDNLNPPLMIQDSSSRHGYLSGRSANDDNNVSVNAIDYRESFNIDSNSPLNLVGPKTRFTKASWLNAADNRELPLGLADSNARLTNTTRNDMSSISPNVVDPNTRHTNTSRISGVDNLNLFPNMVDSTTGHTSILNASDIDETENVLDSNTRRSQRPSSDENSTASIRSNTRRTNASGQSNIDSSIASPNVLNFNSGRNNTPRLSSIDNNKSPNLGDSLNSTNTLRLSSSDNMINTNAEHRNMAKLSSTDTSTVYLNTMDSRRTITPRLSSIRNTSRTSNTRRTNASGQSNLDSSIASMNVTDVRRTITPRIYNSNASLYNVDYSSAASMASGSRSMSRASMDDWRLGLFDNSRSDFDPIGQETPPLSASSFASSRRLEWDNGADIGYRTATSSDWPGGVPILNPNSRPIPEMARSDPEGISLMNEAININFGPSPTLFPYLNFQSQTPSVNNQDTSNQASMHANLDNDGQMSTNPDDDCFNDTRAANQEDFRQDSLVINPDENSHQILESTNARPELDQSLHVEENFCESLPVSSSDESGSNKVFYQTSSFVNPEEHLYQFSDSGDNFSQASYVVNDVLERSSSPWSLSRSDSKRSVIYNSVRDMRRQSEPKTVISHLQPFKNLSCPNLADLRKSAGLNEWTTSKSEEQVSKKSSIKTFHFPGIGTKRDSRSRKAIDTSDQTYYGSGVQDSLEDHPQTCRSCRTPFTICQPMDSVPQTTNFPIGDSETSCEKLDNELADVGWTDDLQYVHEIPGFSGDFPPVLVVSNNSGDLNERNFSKIVGNFFQNFEQSTSEVKPHIRWYPFATTTATQDIKNVSTQTAVSFVAQQSKDVVSFVGQKLKDLSDNEKVKKNSSFATKNTVFAVQPSKDVLSFIAQPPKNSPHQSVLEQHASGPEDIVLEWLPDHAENNTQKVPASTYQEEIDSETSNSSEPVLTSTNQKEFLNNEVVSKHPQNCQSCHSEMNPGSHFSVSSSRDVGHHASVSTFRDTGINPREERKLGVGECQTIPKTLHSQSVSPELNTNSQRNVSTPIASRFPASDIRNIPPKNTSTDPSNNVQNIILAPHQNAITPTQRQNIAVSNNYLQKNFVETSTALLNDLPDSNLPENNNKSVTRSYDSNTGVATKPKNIKATDFSRTRFSATSSNLLEFLYQNRPLSDSKYLEHKEGIPKSYSDPILSAQDQESIDSDQNLTCHHQDSTGGEEELISLHKDMTDIDQGRSNYGQNLTGQVYHDQDLLGYYHDLSDHDKYLTGHRQNLADHAQNLTHYDQNETGHYPDLASHDQTVTEYDPELTGHDLTVHDQDFTSQDLISEEDGELATFRSHNYSTFEDSESTGISDKYREKYILGGFHKGQRIASPDKNIEFRSIENNPNSFMPDQVNEQVSYLKSSNNKFAVDLNFQISQSSAIADLTNTTQLSNRGNRSLPEHLESNLVRSKRAHPLLNLNNSPSIYADKCSSEPAFPNTSKNQERLVVGENYEVTANHLMKQPQIGTSIGRPTSNLLQLQDDFSKQGQLKVKPYTHSSKVQTGNDNRNIFQVRDSFKGGDHFKKPVNMKEAEVQTGMGIDQSTTTENSQFKEDTAVTAYDSTKESLIAAKEAYSRTSEVFNMSQAKQPSSLTTTNYVYGDSSGKIGQSQTSFNNDSPYLKDSFSNKYYFRRGVQDILASDSSMRRKDNNSQLTVGNQEKSASTSKLQDSFQRQRDKSSGDMYGDRSRSVRSESYILNTRVPEIKVGESSKKLPQRSYRTENTLSPQESEIHIDDSTMTRIPRDGHGNRNTLHAQDGTIYIDKSTLARVVRDSFVSNARRGFEDISSTEMNLSGKIHADTQTGAYDRPLKRTFDRQNDPRWKTSDTYKRDINVEMKSGAPKVSQDKLLDVRIDSSKKFDVDGHFISVGVQASDRCQFCRRTHFGVCHQKERFKDVLNRTLERGLPGKSGTSFCYFSKECSCCCNKSLQEKFNIHRAEIVERIEARQKEVESLTGRGLLSSISLPLHQQNSKIRLKQVPAKSTTGRPHSNKENIRKATKSHSSSSNNSRQKSRQKNLNKYNRVMSKLYSQRLKSEILRGKVSFSRHEVLMNS